MTQIVSIIARVLFLTPIVFFSLECYYRITFLRVYLKKEKNLYEKNESF